MRKRKKERERERKREKVSCRMREKEKRVCQRFSASERGIKRERETERG